MRSLRPAILALLLLCCGGLSLSLLLLDEAPPSGTERAEPGPDAARDAPGPAAAPLASSAPPAPDQRDRDPAGPPPEAPAPRALAPRVSDGEERLARVRLSLYAGERLFLEPAEVQLEATLGGEPCPLELIQAPERALQAELRLRWAGSATSPRLVVRGWLRADPRVQGVYESFLTDRGETDSLLDLQLRHELTIRWDRPLAEGQVEAHLLDYRGQSQRSWGVWLDEEGPSTVATLAGLPPGDYRVVALGEDDEGRRRFGERRLRLAAGRPGLVDLALEACAQLEVRVVGPRGQAVGANLCLDGERLAEEPLCWPERRFPEEEDEARQPPPLAESSYLPPGRTLRAWLAPGRWTLRAASADPGATGAAADLELRAGEARSVVLQLGAEAPTPVRLSEDLNPTCDLQLDAPAGASLVYRSPRELLVRGLARGARARLLILRRAEGRLSLGRVELRGGRAAQLTLQAPASAAIALLEPSGELAERLESVDLIPAQEPLPSAFRLLATPEELLSHPESYGAHAWASEAPHELDQLAGYTMGDLDEAGRWCFERLLPGRYRVELYDWPGADFELQLAAGQRLELRRALPPARD